MKKFSDLYEIDDFMEYYKGATKAELRNRLKQLSKGVNVAGKRNERKAIEALLT